MQQAAGPQRPVDQTASDPHPPAGRVPPTRRRLGAVLAIGLLGLSLLGPAPDAAATSLMRLQLSAMAARAHVVAHATVEATRARFLDGEGGTIVTDVRLKVHRGLLGVRDGERITIQQLGGVVGELGQIVHGEARYRVGEEVVVLLAPRPGGLFTVGMTQGALHVRRDEAGVARVHIDAADAELVETAVGPAAAAAAAGDTADGLPLDVVLQRLAALVAAKHPGGR
jgi:hypothetical protein